MATPSDPVLLIKTLLSDNWTIGNTDSIRPIFREPDDKEEQRQGDLVRIYSGRPMERKRLDGRYDFATWQASVTVDIITYGVGNPLTVKPKAHATKMWGEVERILNVNKQNPDAYWDFVFIDSPASVESEYANFFRCLMNIVVQRIGGSVA